MSSRTWPIFELAYVSIRILFNISITNLHISFLIDGNFIQTTNYAIISTKHVIVEKYDANTLQIRCKNVAKYVAKTFQNTCNIVAKYVAKGVAKTLPNTLQNTLQERCKIRCKIVAKYVAKTLRFCYRKKFKIRCRCKYSQTCYRCQYSHTCCSCKIRCRCKKKVQNTLLLPIFSNMLSLQNTLLLQKNVQNTFQNTLQKRSEYVAVASILKHPVVAEHANIAKYSPSLAHIFLRPI